jgi:hypothetical protein
MSHLFSTRNQFGEDPEPVTLRPHNVNVGQDQYAELGPDEPQGRWESPSHYFDRITRPRTENE